MSIDRTDRRSSRERPAFRSTTLAAAVLVSLALAAAYGSRAAGQQALPPPAPAAPQGDARVEGALSARNANYDIDVRLDAAARTLTGHERIRWAR